MKKRFFYAASVGTDNFAEIRISGVVDTDKPIDIDNLVQNISSMIQQKGGENPSVHISQLNFLMDIPE